MKNKFLSLVKLIPWYVWLTSVLFSLIYAFYYKFYGVYVPRGWVWVGGVGGDDSVYLGLMQFVVNQPWRSIFGAESPWHVFSDPGSSKILLTPEFSSPYWFYFLGILSKLLKIAPATFMILVRVGLGFLLPVSMWWFLSSLGVKGGKGSKWEKLAFIFYHFAFGLGGLYFLLFSFFKEGHFNLIPFWPFTAMGNATTYELFEGVGLHPLDFLGRTYYVASIILGLFALVKLSKASDKARSIKHRVYWGLLGGLCLAFSQAIYPITGVGFVVLAVLWLVVSISVSTRRVDKVLGLLAFFAVGAFGGLPWFTSLLADKTHFVTYGALKVNATPLPLLVSTVTLLVPAVLFVGTRGYRGYRGYRLGYWLLVSVEVLLLSVGVFPLRTVFIYFIGVVLALLSFTWWDKKEKTSLFFWLWFLFAFFASIMPIRDWTPFLPARFMLLLWLPLSCLAASFFTGGVGGTRGLGFKKCSLLVAVFVIGTASVFFYSTWFLRKPLRPEVYAQSRGDGGESLRPEYITTEEFKALQFLQTQPSGVALCEYNLGMYLPLLAGHKSFLGRDPMVYKFYDKVGDYIKFFSIGTKVTEAGDIIEKYGLNYVIFGPMERTMSNDIVTMKNFAEYLELAAEFGEGKGKKVEVWKVK